MQRGICGASALCARRHPIHRHDWSPRDGIHATGKAFGDSHFRVGNRLRAACWNRFRCTTRSARRVERCDLRQGAPPRTRLAMERNPRIWRTRCRAPHQRGVVRCALTENSTAASAISSRNPIYLHRFISSVSSIGNPVHNVMSDPDSTADFLVELGRTASGYWRPRSG